jgi:hypothetical protein
MVSIVLLIGFIVSDKLRVRKRGAGRKRVKKGVRYRFFVPPCGTRLLSSSALSKSDPVVLS